MADDLELGGVAEVGLVGAVTPYGDVAEVEDRGGDLPEVELLGCGEADGVESGLQGK